jgi:hypothetical protein
MPPRWQTDPDRTAGPPPRQPQRRISPLRREINQSTLRRRASRTSGARSRGTGYESARRSCSPGWSR